MILHWLAGPRSVSDCRVVLNLEYTVQSIDPKSSVSCVLQCPFSPTVSRSVMHVTGIACNINRTAHEACLAIYNLTYSRLKSKNNGTSDSFMLSEERTLNSMRFRCAIVEKYLLQKKVTHLRELHIYLQGQELTESTERETETERQRQTKRETETERSM